MRSQGASRSENHDGKQQDMTTHEQNAKSDRQTRPEPAHNSHKSKTNDTPRPPRVRPRGQERERKKWSIWYYVVQFSSDKTRRPAPQEIPIPIQLRHGHAIHQHDHNSTAAISTSVPPPHVDGLLLLESSVSRLHPRRALVYGACGVQIRPRGETT